MIALNSRLTFAGRETPFVIGAPGAAGVDSSSGGGGRAIRQMSVDRRANAAAALDRSSNGGAALADDGAADGGGDDGAPGGGVGFGVRPSDTAAGAALLPQLDNLRLKVVARVREHFLRTIAKLQKPKTNVMMIQQGALLKCARANARAREPERDFARFLSRGAPQPAEPLRVSPPPRAARPPP